MKDCEVGFHPVRARRERLSGKALSANIALVAALRAAREETGLSQRALSQAMDESTTFVHMIEGLRRDVSVAEFIEIAKTLKIDPLELLRRALR